MYLNELFGLDGKVALVSGGSRGIGQVLAEGLAKAGADVAILSRSDSSETVALIEAAGRRGMWVKADVVDEPGVEAAIEEVKQELGPIDILFNNAGICMHQTMFEATIEEFREVIDVNLTGEFILARAVARQMIDAGIKGSIINMASISGTIVNIPQMQASYNSSKAGVVHLSKSLAIDLVDKGIRVNSLSPGYIATPMSADTPQELRDAWMPLIPMRRMADPRELMTALLYLASDASSYTTGSDIIVDGGYTLV